MSFLTKTPKETPVNDTWNTFKNKMNEIMGKHIPTKMSKTKYDLPWITREARHLIRQKKTAHKKAKTSKRNRDWAKFRKLRKLLQLNLRKAYNNYINHLLDPTEDKNSKNFWRYMKSMRKDHTGVAPLKSPAGLASDARDKAEILNHQFMSVFTREDTTTLPEKEPSPYPAMPNIQISVFGVQKLLMKIAPKKASGPDLLPARFLKEMAEPVSPILAFIYQQSLDQGEVPHDWREANVSPVFKKGDKGQAVNYRPVSLTSIVCKVLEHIIVSCALDHLDHHNILVDCQHGFRSRRSCDTQLIITSHDLAISLHNRKQVDMAILDFSKAFDKVAHQRLLQRLDYYGIRSNTQAWIKSFLSNRSQRVVVDGVASDSGPVLSGVPQGTVLGPLLFLLYINNITQGISSKMRLFADDCLVYREISSDQDTIALQHDLNTLMDWGKTWLMAFNIDKCHIMRVTLARKKRIVHDYTMGGSLLHVAENSPYLGVNINNKLSWNEHVDKITAKARRTLGFLRRNLQGCPKKIKEQAYTSLVRPPLEYCCPIWDPHTIKGIKKVEAVQGTAARFVANKPFRFSQPDSTTAIVQDLGWESLHQRRQKISLTVFYKMVNGLIEIPTQYHPAPKPLAAITRGHPYQYFHQYASVNAYKYSFIPRTIPLWNRLPSEVVSASSVNIFSQRIAKLETL